MRSLLDHLSTNKHANHIRFLNRTQPMRNRNGSPSLRSLIQCGLYNLLALAVQRASRLIEQQNLRIPNQRASNRNTLLLTTGEESALGATKCVEAFREREDKVLNVGGFACGVQVGFGDVGVRAAEEDVFADRALVESRFLGDERNVGAVLVEVERGDFAAVDKDATDEGVVEAFDETDGG